MANALGMIECRSLPAVLEASDVMLKTAKVELLGYEKTGDGLITVLVFGPMSTIHQAIEKGIQAAEAVGEVISLHVIPNPHPQLLQVPGLHISPPQPH